MHPPRRADPARFSADVTDGANGTTANFDRVPMSDERSALCFRTPQFAASLLRCAPLVLVTFGLHVDAASAQDTSANVDDDAPVARLEEVLVVAQRAKRISTGATNLNLPIKETPQSISVVTQEQMKAFGADSINAALRLATGIQVEEWETNRTNYLSRGFEIANTQIDGVGLPNGWGIVTGAMESFGYEKIEVIRGANGLLTGVGNASGTINYVRKRPTNAEQGQLGISYGSWNTLRVEADYSTPFTQDGRWAGRVVLVHEKGDSYLRDFEQDRNFLYGVVDGQIGENGTLTLGYSWQQANSDHNMWGALTFVNADGTQAEWSRSASTTQDWTYWDTNTQSGFAEYTHQLGADWQLKASYNYRSIANDDQLFFAYTVTGLNPQGGDLLGWAYKGNDDLRAHLGDVTLNGAFSLFGRAHEAMLGVSRAESDGTDRYSPADFSEPAFGLLPNFPYAGDAIPEPVWGARIVSGTTDQRLDRAYGATRLSLTPRLKAVLGFNYAEYHRDGVNSGLAFDQTESNLSPYAGLTFDFTDGVLGYLSYSDLYKPQDQTELGGGYLDPTKGVNYEVGVKAEWLDARLLTTLAWFYAEQEGLATYGGYDFDSAQYWYYGIDVKSQGVEFEATGRLNAYTSVVLGATTLKMSGVDGDDTYPWVPRHTANLMLSAQLPQYPALSFGIGGRWQSKTWAPESYTGLITRQSDYAVLNAFAAWDFTPNATLRANVANLTGEKYINSLYQIGYYGAPTNVTVGLEWRF